MKPASSVVHSELGVMPCISSSPMPDQPEPDAEQRCAARSACASRPAIGATKNDMTVSGRKRRPVSNGV